MRTALLALGLTFVALPSLLAQGPLDSQPVSPHAKKAVELINELRSIGLPDSASEFLVPPGPVPGLLRKLNQELRDLVIDDLNSPWLRGIPSDAEILDQLRAAGWQEVSNNKWSAYGEIVSIHVDWPVERDPTLLLVTTQLWLPCGRTPDDPDTAVYIFQGRARQWQLLLETDADFGQDNGLKFALSPVDDRGKWFLLVAQIPPSCPSPTSSGRLNGGVDVLRFKALRPSLSPEKPTVLFTQRDEISRFFDPSFSIQVGEDSFAVTQGRQRVLDNGYGAAIYRYQVEGNHVQRIPPIAVTPEDFLDQWVQADWADARRWIVDYSGSSIQTWHDRLRAFPRDSTEFRSVQKCSGGADGDQTWLLELWIDRKLNPVISEEFLFISVDRKNGAYSVSAIRKSRLDACPGETPLSDVPDSTLPTW